MHAFISVYLTYSSNLSLYQKEVYSIGIKVFNSLPQGIKNLSGNPETFKSALKNYLHAHSFYFIDECFSVNKEWYTKLNHFQANCILPQTILCKTFLTCSMFKVLTHFGFIEYK